MASVFAFWNALALWTYSLVGYPLLMRLLGRRSARPDDSPEDALPGVTLIIPAYDEEPVIAEKLENALAIDYPDGKIEILVANDGSTDRTDEIARSFEDRGVRVLSFSRRKGKTETVNEAVCEATNNIIALCDANVMFRPDALKRLVARLADPQIGAVSGDVRLSSEESTFGQGESAYYGMERALQLGESRAGSMMGVDGGMFVIRRELYEALPADTIVDDFVLSMRVIRRGKRVVLEPSAVATENATPAAHNEFHRRIRLSAGAMQALKRGDFPPLSRPVEFWQFVSHKLLRWLGPVWLAVLLVANILLWDAGLVYQAALTGQAFLYGTALAATFSLRLRNTRPGGIAFYFVMSHVAMAIGLVKGLFNQQRVTWNRTERSVKAALDTEPEPTATN